MKIISNSEAETRHIGAVIAKNLMAGDIICLLGEFGSGKTVLTKGIARGLKIKESIVNSPSFVLMRQYDEGRLPLFHFDLYRLKADEDIFGLGYEEFFYDRGITVIEWAERLKCLLPEEYLRIELHCKGDTQRSLDFSFRGVRYRQLLGELNEDISH
ncbi:MAG: tRNA (adenosine(37)-N6)-threonylcarbamoyltransferase complex ATPase subunit type 1 TsaE [Candidatus Omnitrophota bacterium]